MADSLIVVDEATQHLIHGLVANMLRNASSAPGASTNWVGKQVLNQIFDPRGPVVALLNKPGAALAMSVIGATLASLVQKADFWDKILPDDVSPNVKALKAALKVASKGITTGIFSGASDALDDIARRVQGVVNQEMDKTISDPALPPASRKGVFDNGVLRLHAFPNILILPKLTSTGAMSVDADGVPRSSHPLWNGFVDMHNVHRKTETKTTSGGGGRGGGGGNTSTTTTTAPFSAYDVVDLSEFFADAGDDVAMRPEDVAQLKTLMAKPKGWWEKIGPKATNFLIILSIYARYAPVFTQILREDYIKDVIDKDSVIIPLQALADRYDPIIQATGQLTQEHIDDIVSVFNNILGSELTGWNKAAWQASVVWAHRARLPIGVKFTAYGALFMFILANFVVGGLFLTGIALVLLGMWIPYDRPFTLSIPFVHATFQDGGVFATVAILFGWLSVMISLLPLRLYEALLSPIFRRLFSVKQDWLVEIAWRLLYLMIPCIAFAIGAFVFHTSYPARFLIVAFVAAHVGTLAGYKVLARNATQSWMQEDSDLSAYSLVRFSVRYSFWLMLAIELVDWLVRNGMALIMGSTFVQMGGPVWSFLTSTHPAAIVLRVFVFGVVIFALAMVLIKRFGIEKGMLRAMILLIALGCGVVMVGFPYWTGAAASATASASAAPAAATNPPPTPAPAPTRARRRAAGQTVDPTADPTATNCANLPARYRTPEAGCP